MTHNLCLKAPVTYSGNANTNSEVITVVRGEPIGWELIFNLLAKSHLVHVKSLLKKTQLYLIFQLREAQNRRWRDSSRLPQNQLRHKKSLRWRLQQWKQLILRLKLSSMEVFGDWRMFLTELF